MRSSETFPSISAIQLRVVVVSSVLILLIEQIVFTQYTFSLSFCIGGLFMVGEVFLFQILVSLLISPDRQQKVLAVMLVPLKLLLLLAPLLLMRLIGKEMAIPFALGMLTLICTAFLVRKE